MCHFRGFAGPPRCATFVALHMSHCELWKCKWESFMTNQNICCDSALASSFLADTESYFWIDFLQGESVEESGSIISHYFRTHFSSYVIPRGLISTINFVHSHSYICFKYWGNLLVQFLNNSCPVSNVRAISWVKQAARQEVITNPKPDISH